MAKRKIPSEPPNPSRIDFLTGRCIPLFYFIRHGETDYNRNNLWLGRQDHPLNQTGIKQVEAAAQAIVRIPLQIIITSPLLRARQTAELIANQHPESPVIKIADWLTERDYGPYESMQKTDANRIAMNASCCVESLGCLAQRLKPLAEVADVYEHFLVVSHSGVYRCLVENLGYQNQKNHTNLSNSELVLFESPTAQSKSS